jgi:hypothetical protein
LDKKPTASFHKFVFVKKGLQRREQGVRIPDVNPNRQPIHDQTLNPIREIFGPAK